jgi:putative ATPase
MSKRDETLSLFSKSDADIKNQPLAARMRPRGIAEYVGQSHILGPGKLLRRAIEADRIHSFIFYGPPGTGKTTLAQIIATQTKSVFEQLIAVESNIKEIRRLLKGAKTRLQNMGEATIVFIDEIHRFSKAQQDALLPDVEKGVIKLIGATTENPYFYISSPIVSRSQIFNLKPLTVDELIELLNRALKDAERGLGHLGISADEYALAHLAKISDGDARKALNALEIAATTTPPNEEGIIQITIEVAEQSIQRKALVYGDDVKADTISAFQKSMRGSDPDAAIYWLVKMIRAGEDPRYIARRMIVCASEDVGLADPMALLMANAAFQAVETIGWPEAKLQLAQATIYIATAPKSNSATRAIEAAEREVDVERTISMPKDLQDRHSPGLRCGGQKFDYKLPHDHPNHFVAQDYLGVNRTFYTPTEQGEEKKIKERVDNWRIQFQAVRRNADSLSAFAPPKSSTLRSTEPAKKPSRFTCSNCSYGTTQKGEIICNHKMKVVDNDGSPKPVKSDSTCEYYQPALP